MTGLGYRASWCVLGLLYHLSQMIQGTLEGALGIFKWLRGLWRGTLLLPSVYVRLGVNQRGVHVV